MKDRHSFLYTQTMFSKSIYYLIGLSKYIRANDSILLISHTQTMRDFINSFSVFMSTMCLSIYNFF